MSELSELIGLVLARGQRMLLGSRFLWTIGALAAFVALVELAGERRWRRYLTRTFLTDLCYFLFFAGGFYYFFFSGPIDRLLQGLRQRARAVPGAERVRVAAGRAEGDPVHRPDRRLRVHDAPRLPPLRLVVVLPRRAPFADAIDLPLTKFRVHFVDMTLFGTVKALPMMMLGSCWA